MSPPKRVDPGFWSGRNVLITGHTGFKGAWLALWLRRLGARVTGLSDGVPTSPSLYELAGVQRDMQEIRGDVRDPAAVAEAVRAAAPQVALHLAAQPLVRRSFAAPAETFAVNVLGTANLLDALREAGGVESVVVVTSDKCYAPGPAPHPETDPLGGDDPYSASKAATEHVAAAYRTSFGLPVATGRAGNVIGGGDWGADRLVPDVLDAALAGRPVELRNPGAVRPWQHVLNPLGGYLLLAQALAEDPATYAGGWNFGPEPGDELPVQALVERIAELWDGPLKIAAQPGEHPPETGVLRLDSTRAREQLGWAPAWDLDEGLRAIVAWTEAYRRDADLAAVTAEQIADYAEAVARPTA
jgi:CDP-glucose 4,6-dehydratase